MQKGALFFVLCAIGIIGYCFVSQERVPLDSTFITIKSYEQVPVSCDKHTLVTFDVDDTLITAQDSAVLPYGPALLPWWFKLYAVIRYPSIVYNFEYLTSLLFAESPRMLVEPIVAMLVNTYRKKCMVIGLTSIETGSWGVIENMPEWRYSMLSSMGIRFSSLPNRVFTQLPKRRGTYPVLYNGILCTNQQPKGEVLGAFLDMLSDKPHRIVSFDDQASALQSIAQACQKHAIPFTGYHYIGTQDKKLFDFIRTNDELKELVQQV